MNDLRAHAIRRGITRLCHFTPSRNLAHIMNDVRGVLASCHLADDESAIFHPTDKDRLDGYPDHVCCSIQYPNGWYFKKARTLDTLFLDWVVLLIDRHYIWQPGTKFCPRNAAARHGRLVRDGVAAFEALFATSVDGVKTYRRGPEHPDCLPTDEQAEVLIPDQVGLSDVNGFVVRDEEQAAREASRLHLMHVPIPRIVIVPEFFEPQALSRRLRTGRIPAEREYHWGGASV